MDPPNGDGPDGTSLKPVSSLRARFENINKTQDGSSQPPSRPISPGPKPDRLRDFKPSHEAAPSTPTTPTVASRPPMPKERPKSMALRPTPDHEMGPPGPPAKPKTRPPTAAKPQLSTMKPPAVTIQPPQSPPKGSVATFVATDQSPYLNPDSVATPTTPATSQKPFKIPTRPHTPTPSFPLPRSPRLGASPAPSPPPPRRSAELRRERESKPPPPAPMTRSEKPLIPAMSSSSFPEPHGTYFPRKADISAEASPFNSPPTSPETVYDETPPELPTRPIAQSNGDARPKSMLGGFEPPPTHYAVAGRRRGNSNGPVMQIPAQQIEEPRPSLPARPQNNDIPTRQLQNNVGEAAPRPPRTGVPAITPTAEASSPVSSSRRISSNPASSQQLPPPPTRTHGRSQTVDRMSERPPPEVRAAGAAMAVPPRPVQHIAPVAAARIEPVVQVTTYPDSSSTNRRPPFMKKGCYEIPTKYDPRIFDVCGEYVCTSGHLTRVWSITDGEQLMSLAHTEGVKATAVAFKPAADPREEGGKVWIGTNLGEIMEVDIATHRITGSKGSVHGRNEVMRIYRHYNEFWTLDDGGTLLLWGPDADGVPNLSNNPSQSYKVPKAHTFSMVVGDELWHATGKEVRVFAPTEDGRTQFQVLVRPMVADGAGEVTSGTLVKTQPDKVFLGHADGKISIFSTTDYCCLTVLNISTWKISALVGAGPYMWASYNTGKVCVYDMGVTPWVVMKEWQAHDNPVVKMKIDPASAYNLDRIQVLSLGADNKVKAWDGLLQDDWIEDEMKSKDTTYCDFDEIKALVLTWNAGASTPHSLRYSGEDSTFFQQLLQSSDSPDILVFGFQELVDLEDKAATAKRFFKTKKKEGGSDQERMSHQYRDWRDFLLKTLDDYMPAEDLYHLLHTAPMVGLFTCIFVKASMRHRIRNLSAAEVKRGMGGLHGNKGAVAVRFQVDDSSLCFVNCHLAAGQSQVSSRNNDVASILEANMFPSERDANVRIDTFTGGGDGTLILDHELCIFNGDLNYRIDTMSRDTVVAAVKQRNLGKLLERDQLLVARRRNPAFRLRAFEELPITFAPTYKYDVGTDTYDTSEKRRSPAWCDRLLFRGRGRVQQLDYRRHEVRVSDHRPVTGSFRLWVKRIDEKARAAAWMESQQGFEAVRQRELADEKLRYLTDTCGFDEATSRTLTK